MKLSFFTSVVSVVIILSGMTGCATKEYVKKQNDEILKKVEANQTEIGRLKKTVSRQNQHLNELWNTVQEALERAEKAGKLAEGKFLYGVTLSDEYVYFAFDKSDLSDKARAALDVFATDMKAKNKNVYIEIQGHTDNVGGEEYNLKLGKARAKQVMRYLYLKHGIPLHRMRAFSYGESKPVVDNKTPSNRAKNRRITLVVME
jgi:outer membrane protein OmpA-like peptidoglycan-associated protein